MTPPVTAAEPANYPALLEAAAYAALHTGSLGIHAPMDHWTGLSTGGATTILPTGIRLIHAARAHGSCLLAYAHCHHGHEHWAPITHANDLDRFHAALATAHGTPGASDLPDLIYLPITRQEPAR